MMSDVQSRPNVGMLYTTMFDGSFVISEDFRSSFPATEETNGNMTIAEEFVRQIPDSVARRIHTNSTTSELTIYARDAGALDIAARTLRSMWRAGWGRG